MQGPSVHTHSPSHTPWRPQQTFPNKPQGSSGYRGSSGLTNGVRRALEPGPSRSHPQQCQTRVGGSVPWGCPPPWSSARVGSAHFLDPLGTEPRKPTAGTSPLHPLCCLSFSSCLTSLLWNHTLVPGSALGKPTCRASPIAQSVKNPPARQESAGNAGDPARFLGWEDPLDKESATYSSILAWEIP